MRIQVEAMATLEMFIIIRGNHLIILTMETNLAFLLLLPVLIFFFKLVFTSHVLLEGDLISVFVLSDGNTGIKTGVYFCFDITIHLVLGRFRITWHRTYARTPPWRPSVFILLLLFNLSFQCLSFFNFLSFCQIFIN